MDDLAQPQHDSLEGISSPGENPVLIGHADAKARVLEAIRAGQLPHALLLAGPLGVGKATFAFHLARHLLGGGSPTRDGGDFAAVDRTTSLFRQVASGAHPSVLHLTRPLNEKTEKFKTALTVDEVRRIGRFLGMTAHDGGYRIVIVDSADDMNANAANALLKNLEEPPPRVLFLLVTHAGARVLPTIRSRCQILRFSPLSDDDLIAATRAIGVALPKDQAALRVVLEKANGSVRDAVMLSRHGGLDFASKMRSLTASGKLDMQAVLKLADQLSGRDSDQAFDLANEVALDLLTDAASAAARAGQGARADRISRRWQEIRIAIRDAETYNLDCKQHAMTMILRLHDTLRM